MRNGDMVHGGWTHTLALSALAGCSLGVTADTSAPPAAARREVALIEFRIARQPLAAALYEFAFQSRRQILFKPELTEGKYCAGLRGSLTADAALQALLANSGLVATRAGDDMFIVGPADAPDR